MPVAQHSLKVPFFPTAISFVLVGVVFMSRFQDLVQISHIILDNEMLMLIKGYGHLEITCSLHILDCIGDLSLVFIMDA